MTFLLWEFPVSPVLTTSLKYSNHKIRPVTKSWHYLLELPSICINCQVVTLFFDQLSSNMVYFPSMFLNLNLIDVMSKTNNSLQIETKKTAYTINKSWMQGPPWVIVNIMIHISSCSIIIFLRKGTPLLLTTRKYSQVSFITKKYLSAGHLML